MVDLAIGLGLPVMEMILRMSPQLKIFYISLIEIISEYIPQGHRFDIYEDFGCFPFTYNTPVALVLVSVPPVLIGCISAVYSVLSIRAFSKSRAQFKELLSGNNNLSTDRYIRLMLLAGIEALCTVPIGAYTLYLNGSVGVVSPWLGWADTHAGFSRVDQYPSIIWHFIPGLYTALELTRWFPIMCAIIFFAFFGFAEEARKNYRSAVQSVAKHTGISSSFNGTGLFSSNGSVTFSRCSSRSGSNLSFPYRTKSKGSEVSTTGRGTLPVFVQRHTLRKHDSLDSFSDMSASFADVGGILDEKDEKDQTLTHEISYDTLVLPDVGGTLADYKPGPYSPTPSSGSSSASSMSSPSHSVTALPPTAVTRPDSESFIEISSVRHLQVGECVDALPIPEPIYSSPPRHAFDGPSPV